MSGYARAGGLLSVVPIFYTALMLHESVPLSAKVERTPGLAADLLDRSGIKTGQMLFVYSNSGVNHLPVEMALEAKKRGVVTVTIGSIERTASLQSSSMRATYPQGGGREKSHVCGSFHVAIHFPSTTADKAPPRFSSARADADPSPPAAI